MSKLFQSPISTSNLYLPDFDRVLGILQQAHDSSGHLERGKVVGQLENQLCEYHHAKYCVAFSTGFWALVAAIRLRAAPDKTEVIIPSMTYRRLADVVYWADKIPVIVDNEPDGLAIDCDAVIDALTAETALILAVHPIVNCCDVDRLMSISNTFQVPIVFDAVESVHETYRGRRIGSFGVGEVFSLHASKLINGLEGGYVCTDDSVFRDQLMDFRSGDSARSAEAPLSINAELCDPHAAFALASLQEIDLIVAHNREVYETYRAELASVAGIRLLTFDDSQQTSQKNVVVEVTEEFVLSRDVLMERLNQQHILARPHYYPALHDRGYEYPVRYTKTQVADQVMKHYLNLPCGDMVSVDDVRKTCAFIKCVATLERQDAQGP
ncbi:aminotransferase class I/II-fold pyridoxal phosphate-dependent enzyme [Stieleria varia]|uniref:dTDP-4-amino-4,6-dideoxy-D-glucose transaminase n=1 Tax=Stieleria varia TaxID=2528005 RepID=A0A5C6B5I9_9BACT|nr:aminotransferase class I/II-fold pyridoxal phosphate-dependent enzyme [Stieleria varia]TWU05754.1 dTDP-4-amino-4,6-dideoxy-D-glucose transaminase [Stieleria varia]